MKENAVLCSDHPDGIGGMQLLVGEARKALARRGPTESTRWELHVVAHSAGAIFGAQAISLLTRLGVAFKTLQFLGPAIRIDLFNKRIAPLVAAGKCPRPTVYVLSDEYEEGDSVGAYGKSLLHLVSNAFEGSRATPLLGIRKHLAADPVASKLVSATTSGLANLVVSSGTGKTPNGSRSLTHGGFDNDPVTLNGVLTRILGGVTPARRFEGRDLQY